MDIKPCDKTIILGRQGENLANTATFDRREWVERYGAGTFQLLAKRAGDPAPYPVDIAQNLGIVTWVLTSADTAHEGYGAAELYYYVGDVLAKSEIWQTRVLPSLGDAGEEPPEPYQSWVDAVLTAAQSVEEAVEHYPYIDPTTYHWMAWDVEEEAWYDTGVDGRGIPGEPGAPGADGFSPIVTITEGEGEHTLTITDAEGEHSTVIKDGEPGEDGYTPVRGVDYWTDADKTEIVSDVQTAIAPTLAGKADKTDLADTDRRLGLLYDLTRGQAWKTEQSTAEAYSKAVPSGAHAVEIESIGGKSVVRNQQMRFADSPDWHRVFATGVWDGNIFTVTPSQTNGRYYYTIPTVIDHVYLVRGQVKPSDALQTLNVGANSKTKTITGSTDWTAYENIYIANSDTNNFVLQDLSATVAPFQAKEGEYIDLTKWFGATVADTITTPEQAYALGCPRAYIPYDTGTVVSADVDKVVSAGDDTSAELTIPPAIRALTGYGWSAGTVYNEVDYSNKQYIQRVGSVDIGTISWSIASTWGTGCFYARQNIGAKPHAMSTLENQVCEKGWASSGRMNADVPDKSISINSNAHTENTIAIKDSTYDGMTAAEFKEAMSGVMLYYELATPVITDISQYLTDFDPLMDAEGGGSLTFHQSGGTELPVPNSETYYINIAEALT